VEVAPVVAVLGLVASQLLLVGVMWRIQRAAATHRRRAAFGTEPDLLVSAVDGEAVTLRGTLVTGGPIVRRCRGVRQPLVLDAELLVDGAAVRLSGPCEVVVGSREVVLGAEHGVRRELYSGDRVLVQGCLRRVPCEGAVGYRDNPERWIVVAEDDGMVALAFAGLPQTSGLFRVVASALPSGWIAAAGATAICGSVLAAAHARPAAQPHGTLVDGAPPVGALAARPAGPASRAGSLSEPRAPAVQPHAEPRENDAIRESPERAATATIEARDEACRRSGPQ
jgi:hypothetical protein